MAYFVIQNDRQEGPLEAEQIKSLVAGGSLAWTDLCWREGWRQWRPIGSVAALAPPEAFAPATQDSLSEAGEEFRDNASRRNHASWSSVIILAVLLMFAVAGLAVQWVLLARAQERIAELEKEALHRKNLETATAPKILEAKAPVPGNEIRVWATFLDPVAARPVPVSRANILLYRAEAVAGALESLRKLPPAIGVSPLAAIQEKLPAPWRETITGSDGIAVFQEVPPDDYVLVAFSIKSTGSGELPYLWLAEQKLNGQPHATLVLTEENASREGSAPEVIEP